MAEAKGNQFKVGEKYVVFAGHAHYACEVVKRTKATVTFAVPERFEHWLTGELYPKGGMTVTLRKGKVNYVDEYVTGTPKTWRKCKLEAFA